MKVLYIAGRVNMSNGAYHSLLSSVVELKKKNIQAIVVLHEHGAGEDELKRNGIECTVLPYQGCTVPADNPSKIKGILKEIINSFAERKIAKIIKEEKIDIVHINVSTTSIGAKSAKKMGVPLVWHLREFLEDDVNLTYINKKRTQKLLQSANHVIAISNAVGNHFIKEYELKKVSTIYNGIKMDSLPSIQKNTKLDNYTMTIVGRIVKTKGQLDAIKALKILNEQMKINLIVAGDIGDYSYYDEIEDYINKNDLKEKVKFMPHMKDLHPIWNQTDVAVICSTREGFGRVTAEFMLNGKIVVGSNTGATTELLDNNRGYLFEYGNVQDLAQKVMEALINKEETYLRERNAQEYAQKYFSAQHCASEIFKVYEELVN